MIVEGWNFGQLYRLNKCLIFVLVKTCLVNIAFNANIAYQLTIVIICLYDSSKHKLIKIHSRSDTFYGIQIRVYT